MQPESYIIPLGLLVGWAFTAFYFLKALQRAHLRGVSEAMAKRNDLHSQRISVLNRDLTHLNSLRESELEQHSSALKTTKAQLAAMNKQASIIKATPFTKRDHQDLVDSVETLRLALDTWKAFPGTELFRARAIEQQRRLTLIAARLKDTIDSAWILNRESIDTQLIEWLELRSGLSAVLETSTIDHPQKNRTETYVHLRDALREAFELDRPRCCEHHPLPAWCDCADTDPAYWEIRLNRGRANHPHRNGVNS